MDTLDNATLIQKFIQQETTLAANQTFRVESAFGSVQLWAKRGALVATLKLVKQVPTVSLRRQSEYAELLHQTLISHRFIPVNALSSPEFEQYQEQQLPVGYVVNSTEVKFLWREWWKSARDANRHRIQLDVLVSVRGMWYPIRDIVCSQGTLFIETLGGEVVHQGTDRIIWLSRVPHQVISSRLTSQHVIAAFETGVVQTGLQHSGANTNVTPIAATSLKGIDNNISTPDLGQVLKLRQGKLFITTAIGEVVVEGGNLKFWLSQANSFQPPVMH